MEVAVRRISHSRSLTSSGGSASGSENDELHERRIKSAIVEAPIHPQHRPMTPDHSPPPRLTYDKRERRRQRRSPSAHSDEEEDEPSPPPKRKREEPDPLLTRTGGAYIPPARLRMMQENITDKSSAPYQRLAWEALKKSINGLINKVNISNISNILGELFLENVVRGRGLLARSLIQAQSASPMFTHVYAALVAIINTKFPQTGELIAKRLIIRFRKSFRRNDKTVCIAAVKFLAHLVNQIVLHELVALELLTLLLEEPSDDSVEVAVGFIKECGKKLTEVTPKGIHAVFETFRSILQSGKITSRVEYMIEVLFAVRKDNFKAYPSVQEELDLIDEDDQITHLLSLADEDLEPEDLLNVFQFDPNYLENEEKYKFIKEEILGEGSESDESGEGSSSDESEEEESEADEEGNKMEIIDQTGSKELSVRRQIYLTIMSSLDFEECAHKLLKTMGEGHEKEIALMLVECCCQERSYLRFYGLLGERLCLLNQAWVAVFNESFGDQYATVHRLETNKLRNVAKFFGQLFYMDALPWTSMECIHLNEEETNSSSRIFIKILFQELAEFMGLPKLNKKLRDPMLAPAFEGIMPRDNPKNTRFAINFFTSIGLGGLTDDLREHLKNAQKLIMAQKQEVSSSDSSSSSSESESDSDSSSSDSESSSEEEERKRRSKKHTEHRRRGSTERRTKKRKESRRDEDHHRRRERSEEKVESTRERKDKEDHHRRRERSEEKVESTRERHGRRERSEEKVESTRERRGRRERSEEKVESTRERKERHKDRREHKKHHH